MPPLSEMPAIVTSLVRQVLRDDVMGLAAELAYRAFLALFPFAIFVVALGGFVARAVGIANPAADMTRLLEGAAPSQAVDLIAGEVRRVVEQREVGLLSFGGVTALFFATSGTNSLLKGMNRAFEVPETRPIVRRYLVSAALTIFAGAAIVASVLLFVVGEVVGGSVAARLGLGGTFGSFVAVARWPVLALLLAAAVAVLYRYGPNTTIPGRPAATAALAVAVTWLLGGAVFAAYVRTIAGYGATYGALAGVAILLIWLYLSSFVLLAGAELAAVLARWGTSADGGAGVKPAG